MRGILADHNVNGQVKLLVSRFQGSEWLDVWTSLNLSVLNFEDLGLDARSSDLSVWQACQERQVVLITANRNKEGMDSLEETLEKYNTDQSLPVFILADPKRIKRSGAYAARVVERLLEYLLEIDKVRGTGRLYLP